MFVIRSRRSDKKIIPASTKICILDARPIPEKSFDGTKLVTPKLCKNHKESPISKPIVLMKLPIVYTIQGVS